MSALSVTTMPPTTSLWPLMYFVVECQRDVGAEFDRALQVRRTEGVVDRDQLAGLTDRADRGDVDHVSSGFVGVSTQNSFVAGVTAARTAAEIFHIDEGGRDAVLAA